MDNSVKEQSDDRLSCVFMKVRISHKIDSRDIIASKSRMMHHALLTEFKPNWHSCAMLDHSTLLCDESWSVFP